MLTAKTVRSMLGQWNHATDVVPIRNFVADAMSEHVGAVITQAQLRNL